MKANRLAVALAPFLLCSMSTFAAAPPSGVSTSAQAGVGKNEQSESLIQKLSKPLSSITHSTVAVEGNAIDYEAVAGTLVLDGTGVNEGTPQVAMSYFAYFKQGADPVKRPIMFLYNGGPGSSTMWLHMGAWGPKRVVTSDDAHTPAAPYRLVNNDYSLLDASDVVFIDMPGTGFGRLLGHGKDETERAKSHRELADEYWSIDGDAQAFSRFITQFLSKYNRWNSPKYLFGESYGTVRSAVVARILEEQDNVDLNGVVLLSEVLDFRISPVAANINPDDNLPYVTALPTFAATAWYHHKLPKYDHGTLAQLLKDSIAFAKGDYQQALFAGSTLGPTRKREIAEKLHDFIGLPLDYLMKADLRVNSDMFTHQLLSGNDTTTGLLDTRYVGPSMDPLAKESDYDPQGAAIGSAYVSAFNSYVRNDMKFGEGMEYRPSVYGDFNWKFEHKQPGMQLVWNKGVNVLRDLAAAMKYNPNLKVMVNGGFYDLVTPFYGAIHEEENLPIPQSLRKNITYAFYPSGHMVYAHVPSLKQLHDNVAAFIDATDDRSNGK
ncbi:MAG: peptidase S10 [Xanthomonadaceae bacterium]|nr:peptidase S10 [Xanthomonadaceae bacterium]